MINKLFPSLLLSFLLIGCNASLKEPVTITIDQSILDECETAACPEVSVEYIEYDKTQKKSEAVNDSITTFIIKALNLGDPSAKPLAKNTNEAIHYFVKDYWRDTSEFPGTNEYEAEVFVDEIFRSEALISISMSQYCYTGGAHGYNSTSYLNVNAKNGKIITNKQLFKDEDAIKKLAEKKLRIAYNLSDTDTINAGIFWFENGRFYLPKAIGFNNNNLLIKYNVYEIASYADGAITIEIPLKEAAPFLNYSIE